MKSIFAYLLVSLVLLQTLSREVLLVDFTLHRTELATRFCVNKARPLLHCDGKCYFAKLAKKQEQRQSQSASSLKERLEMLPVAFRSLVPAAPARWRRVAPSYGPYRAAGTYGCVVWGIFRPPQA